MVSLGQLWLPIVLSAVVVFLASSVIHMVLKYHNSDYHGFSNEEEVRAAIRKGSPAPGQYMLPYVMDPKEFAKPDVAQKFVDGPVGLLLLRRPGPMSMTPMLVQWFIYCLVLSLIVAYLAAHALEPGAGYLGVFRIAGTAAFLGYAGAHGANGIWMGHPWRSVAKHVVDGFIYGLVTAGVFGWLWPGR